MCEEEKSGVVVVKAKPSRKFFKPPIRIGKVPQQLLNDPLINAAIAALPANYNFEVHKTIWRIRELKAKRVVMQMPEGLVMFATTIADIIEEFTEADVVIMGDVTYGACCIDDYSAKALGADLLIHYGHSCLIPIDQTTNIQQVLYIFVDIKIDIRHCIECVQASIEVDKKIALVSTIQFVGSLEPIANELRKADYHVKIPQSRPLSPGEILGCTAPKIDCADVIVYVGDGRFHLEAAMIANPTLKAYRYDPYAKKLTIESYDYELMLKVRKDAITEAKSASRFALLFSTLGRQGSPKVLNTIEERIKNLNKEQVIILLSEIFPDKLNNHFNDIDAFIQIACPRLSIDWGRAFHKPMLTPFEGALALNTTTSDDLEESKDYPMDYYATVSRGPWTPNHKPSAQTPKACCGKCSNANN